VDRDDEIFTIDFGLPNGLNDANFGPVAETGLTEDFILSDLTVKGSLAEAPNRDTFLLGAVDLIYSPLQDSDVLQAGDADQDLDFDQMDLVQVQVAAKFLTATAATWGEGDWDGAPGGSPGNPPAGDGLFNQIDIVAALLANVYLTGPYAAITPGGNDSDEQTSLVYDAQSGELRLNTPASKNLTSINITSASSKFLGDKPAVLGDAFDNFAPDNIFKATFGGGFGDLSFGTVLPAALSEVELAADLSVQGSLEVGGALGSVDLIYIPEPTASLLMAFGILTFLSVTRRQCCMARNRPSRKSG
jgi:hypothetical protein